jgi:hypothetical protein
MTALRWRVWERRGTKLWFLAGFPGHRFATADDAASWTRDNLRPTVGATIVVRQVTAKGLVRTDHPAPMEVARG